MIRLVSYTFLLISIELCLGHALDTEFPWIAKFRLVRYTRPESLVHIQFKQRDCGRHRG